MEPHTAQSQPSGSHSSRSAEEDRNYEKYERRKGFISLLEHKYAQQPDDEGRKCFLNALVEYANAHLPSSCSCSFSIGEDYNVEEYTGVFILILGCMFAQQPDGERRKGFLTAMLERISPQQPSSCSAFEEECNDEKYERRKGLITLLEHIYAEQPDDERRKGLLTRLVEYINAQLPSSCRFSLGEDYNVEEYTGFFILILGCMFAQQPDGERRKSFLTTLLERISPQQPSSRRAFEEECNDERRKGLLTTLQEHIGETVPSTTWALLWLADIEKLEDWVNLTKSTAEQRISDFTRLALTNIGVGYNIISSCTYGARP